MPIHLNPMTHDNTELLALTIQAAPVEEVQAMLREVIAHVRVQTMHSAMRMALMGEGHQEALASLNWLMSVAEQEYRAVLGVKADA